MSELLVEQALYARLQDAEDAAKDLDPAHPHREKEAKADRCVELCHDLSEHFRLRGDTWRMRVAEYRERKQTGE